MRSNGGTRSSTPMRTPKVSPANEHILANLALQFNAFTHAVCLASSKLLHLDQPRHGQIHQLQWALEDVPTATLRKLGFGWGTARLLVAGAENASCALEKYNQSS
ncbi:hypothetical protein PCASD_02356 [Puccinia coronata f. sp. avenae]|uniref:Uncharacterized protein n=1 Tax=Puccinia coronata f. sp. avenae TaxID=200324 RepID=A0A2N5VAV4_9BASI|nr:hypothetical protein PCASD_02356 [Puccinia coronata f. sp. avenae]